MSKKISKYMPLICMSVLIIIFFVVAANAIVLKIKSQGIEIKNEFIDENRKVDLEVRYPNTENNKKDYSVRFGAGLIAKTDKIKDKVRDFTSIFLPNYYKISECYKGYNSSIGWNCNIISDWDENNILKLDNGYMSVTCEKSNENELIDKVIKIREFVDFLGGGAEKKQKWNKFLLY